MSATKEHLAEFHSSLEQFINTNTAELGANHPAILSAQFMADTYRDFAIINSNDRLVKMIYLRLTAALYNIGGAVNA